MGVHYDRRRGQYVVRWRDGDRRRCRRFPEEQAALSFESELGVRPAGRPPADTLRSDAGVVRFDPSRAQSGDGVYSYMTKDGVRWRFSFRQSDGTLSTRRGFTSRTAARRARRQLVESVQRGEVVVAREDFRAF